MMACRGAGMSWEATGERLGYAPGTIRRWWVRSGLAPPPDPRAELKQQIYALWNAGKTQSQIGKAVHCSVGAISGIVTKARRRSERNGSSAASVCPRRQSAGVLFLARRVAFLRAWDVLLKSGAGPEEIGALLHDTIRQMRAHGGATERLAAD